MNGVILKMAKAEEDIYIYKVVADIGGAPCVAHDLLSLAICKPKIRKNAEPGSLIFGFGGKKYGERLLYIACVTDKPEPGDYYRERQYSKRADCIYRAVNGTAQRKRNARYHFKTDERRSDVGLHFENGFVLLSTDFRYFGANGTTEYKAQFPRIHAMVTKLKRGHRRNHSPALRAELLELKTDVWKQYRRRKLGAPTEEASGLRCNTDSPSAAC